MGIQAKGTLITTWSKVLQMDEYVVVVVAVV